MASAPSFSTTTAIGRSPHLSSGIAITAASATAACPIRRFSMSTDEIHSPPDLTRSLVRSVIRRQPWPLDSEPRHPLWNQPSSVNFSAPLPWKYAAATHGPRTSSSPIA